MNTEDIQERLLVEIAKDTRGEKKNMPTPTYLDKKKHRKGKPENG